jgi:hypothetical protein
MAHEEHHQDDDDHQRQQSATDVHDESPLVEMDQGFPLVIAAIPRHQKQKKPT